MSYELADGSKSTDYKIGDEFTSKWNTFTLEEDDGTRCPFFNMHMEGEVRQGGNNVAYYWADLKPVKEKKKECTLAKQIRKTIKQLEKTLKELEG